MPGIAVSVQAEPTDLRSWLALARRLESAGFHGLLMGDHPGFGASPWPALGSAAAVTQTLHLGTYVVQAGVREPIHVAADAATLDTLAPDRVLLGLGAGHTPREWADIGRDRPRPRQRAARLAEFVEAVAALLRGRTVIQDGEYLTLRSRSPATGRPPSRRSARDFPAPCLQTSPARLSCSSAATKRWPLRYALRRQNSGSPATSSASKPFPPLSACWP
jgi:alkanesulfonate monooxygenase SsuD/methylene tetrahydromethanopterin reductase-like flavin-dependent oxidoreductase (luciferase family)